jgi:hypothetical protein
MTTLASQKLQGVDLSRVYNRNEKRVVQAMERIFAAVDDWDPEALDIQDVYALALNSLPPRYVQDGTIVFNESVRNAQIEQAVRRAVDKVRQKPNY